MTDTQMIDWGLKQFGPPTVMLAIFIVGLLRKWWVIGWQYTEVQNRADKWEALAMQGMSTASKAVTIAQRSG